MHGIEWKREDGGDERRGERMNECEEGLGGGGAARRADDAREGSRET